MTFQPNDTPEFVADVQRRRSARMEAIDALSPDIRSLVHDYGYPTVKTCMDLGVTKAKHIRHLVETVLNEFSPTRGAFSIQGRRTQLDGDKGAPTP